MKKTLSLEKHIFIGHFLKVAHISTLKASTILANHHGKSKNAFLRLKKINDDLFQLRCDLENMLYRDLRTVHGEIKLRQCYPGQIDKKLLKDGENLFP